MDHRFSPRRDQDPEGDAGGYGPGLGPEAYQGFKTHVSSSSEGGGSHRSHSGTRQRAWKPSGDSCCAPDPRTGYSRIRRRRLTGSREP
eukprot:2478591-Pleurochrysis_carterae.AAC.1